MQSPKTLIIIILFSVVFLVLLSPAHVAAQESFKGNSGESFAPSTIIIIIMAIIFLFTGCLAVFLRRFSDGCFGLHVIPINHPDFSSDGQPTTSRGLDADVIKSLPTYFYADVKQHRKSYQVELECAVCLTEFKDPETLRLIPGCSHVFHPHCIDPWLAAHVTCPVCRQSLEHPQSGNNNNNDKPPHSIINIVPVSTTTAQTNDQSNKGSDEHAPQHDDQDEMIHNGVKKMIVGKFPRSHSTGHSIKRHTLVLPEEVLVQNNNNNMLLNRTKAGLRLGGMVSPTSGYKCGWFSMTPPVTLTNSRTRSSLSSGLIKSTSSKNLTIPHHQVKTTSDRFWNI